MMKLMSMSALASVAVLAAGAFSPSSAASVTTNLSVGHISAAPPPVSGGHFTDVNIGTGSAHLTPHGPKYKGPVVTDEGGCHTKANSIQRCYP